MLRALSEILGQAYTDARERRRGEQRALTIQAISAVGTIISALVAVCAVLIVHADSLRDSAPLVGAPEVPTTATGGFELRFVNVGRTAPSGLYIGARTVDLPRNWMPLANRFCEKGLRAARQHGAEFQTFTLIPGEQTSWGDTKEGDISISRPVSELLQMREPHVLGCVVYQDHRTHWLHKTMFAGRIIIAENRPLVPRVYAVQAN